MNPDGPTQSERHEQSHERSHEQHEHPEIGGGASRRLSCAACDALMIDHVYGETGDDDRSAVARHLATCPTCALAFCRLKADLDGVLEATVMAPPGALRRRIREEMAKSFGPRWTTRLLDLWRRPVPVYGVVFASLIPVMIWVAATLRPPGEAALREEVSDSPPPALTDYDSMVPLLPEDLPI